jgi:hypothetical protein
MQKPTGIWRHGCAEGSSVPGRGWRQWAGTDESRERDASVAPDPVAALSLSVVTDRVMEVRRGDGSGRRVATKASGKLPAEPMASDHVHSSWVSQSN